MPKVSVIIPTYNYGKYIERAIASLLSQSYRDLEIIVVDDGSTDNTSELIESKYRNSVRYLYQENKGAPAARNKGIETSKGNYLIFLDADDFLGEDTISKLVACSKKGHNSIIYGPWSRYEIVNGKLNSVLIQENFQGLDMLEGWLYGWYTASCSLLWPREIVEFLGGWDESLLAYQDGDIAIRALIAGYDFSYCPEAFSFAMKHPKGEPSVSSVNDSKQILESKLRVIRKIEKLLQQKRLISKYRKALAANYYALARKHILYIPDLPTECYKEFRRLRRFGKPPGNLFNWILVITLGLQRKEKFAHWVSSLFRRPC